MDVVLLDTNIVSFLLKGDSRAKSYAPHLRGRILAISFMTVAEGSLPKGRPRPMSSYSPTPKPASGSLV